MSRSSPQTQVRRVSPAKGSCRRRTPSPCLEQVASPVHFTRRGELKSFMLAGAPKEPQLPVLSAPVGLKSSESNPFTNTQQRARFFCRSPPLSWRRPLASFRWCRMTALSRLGLSTPYMVATPCTAAVSKRDRDSRLVFSTRVRRRRTSAEVAKYLLDWCHNTVRQHVDVFVAAPISGSPS